jgi:helix-turn-helix protein
VIVSARKGAPGVQQEEQAMNSVARRMFELVEPIGVIPYSAGEPGEAMFALGFTSYRDTYFAGRAAPLGLAAAEVADALFCNFAPGEVARHSPKGVAHHHA